MYKNLILKLFVFFLLFAFTNSKIISNAAELLIFHNSNCENCVIIKELHLMPLLKNYNFQYIDFDITEKRNYELLLKVEKYFGDTDNPDLPVVIFNNNIYSGKTEILNNLRNALDNSQNSNGKPEDIEKLIIKLDKLNYAINNDAKKINIIYFYKSGCNDCARINKDLEFLNKQNTNLQIFKYNIADSYSINLYEFLSEKYNIPNTLRFITPAVFIADKFLINDNLTIHEIQKILSEPNIVNIEISEFDNYQKNPNLKIFERFKNFKILPIVLAGLIDGINPCAFAVIIFFVSYLFILKKSSNTIILAGLSFIAGIYIVYLLIGAGFLEIIFKFKLFAYINNIIYYFFVSILLLFGLINLYDFLIVYKTGKTQNMIGQLSLPQKLKIHNFIKRSQKSKAIYIATFVCGLIISIYEFSCTGQIYIPTIIYILKIANTINYKIQAYIYLLIYNFAFILPLVIVLIIAYKTMRADKIINFFNKNIALTKLLMAILFLVFAALFVFFK